MVRGIIVGHGDFAKALVATAEQIAGEQTDIAIVSNRGCSCETLAGHIADVISEGDPANTIIFLDLPGGSCTISCYTLLKDHPDLNVVGGVNLPMLIEFFMLREQYAAQDLVPVLLKKGKDNMVHVRSRK